MRVDPRPYAWWVVGLVGVILVLAVVLGFWNHRVNAPLPGTAQKLRSAGEILEEAKGRAEEQHKLIFLEFSASWCGPCHELDDFVTAPEIAPILEKYFVFAKVNILEENGRHPELNTPGGEQLMKKFGGLQGIPYIVFFDANGETIVTSERPVEGSKRGNNIGYPATPEEIDWFLAMLKKSVPEMRIEETRKIEVWLRKASTKK